jgi:adhesin/invasin
LVGANGVNGFEGAAYLYSTSGTLLQTFQDPGKTAYDEFGSVALSGNDVLVGAWGINSYRGAAYLYDTSGNLLQTFQDPNNTQDDMFGESVALSGTNMAVGAPRTNANSGEAYIYKPAPTLNAVLGNNQGTVVGTAFGTLLEAQASDANGNPLSGVRVTFTASKGGNGASGSFSGAASATVMTNAQGIAIAPALTADSVAGTFTVSAQLGSIASNPNALFNLTNMPGAAVQLAFANVALPVVVAGQNFNFQVDVEDGFGNLVTGDSSMVSATMTGPGGFRSTTTVQAIGGVASFIGMATAAPGSYTLTVADGSLLTPAAVGLSVTAAKGPGISGNPQLLLLDPSGAPKDGFGTSVATWEDNVLVGTGGSNGSAGVAFLYDMTGNLLQTYEDPSNTPNDYFGQSVAVSDGLVLVGAYGFNTRSGAVYLYDTSGDLLQTYQEPSPASAGWFGLSVAVSGSYVLVGAPGVNGSAGAAYLYDTSGNLLHTIADPRNMPGDYFGTSVALSGSNVLVGAWGTNGTVGAAYLFDTGGTLLKTLQDPGNMPLAGFGYSVALSGSNVLVGGATFDLYPGAAYLFDTSGKLLQTFQEPSYAPMDGFGSAVALSGTNVLVGANQSNGFRGAAYLYSTSGNLLETFLDPNNSPHDAFGSSVALSGSNVLVGGPGINAARGGAYLYETPATLNAVAGNTQSTVIGTAFGTLLAAQVTDASGNPLSGVSVTFTTGVGANGASGFFGDPSQGNIFATVTSNAQGIAVAPVLMGIGAAGSFTVSAAVGSLGTTFNLMNTPGPVAAMVTTEGSDQNAAVGTAFGTPLSVLVTDAWSDPIAGVPVTFTAPARGATGIFAGHATVPTNAAGIAQAPPLTANHVLGKYTVTATAAGLAGSASFTLTNTRVPAAVAVAAGSGQTTPIGGEFPGQLQAKVTDASGRPVVGITVVFEVPADGPGAVAAGATAVLTDAGGIATSPALIANMAAGNFTVLASVAGVATPASFSLTNAPGPAAAVTASGGTPQSTGVSKPYSQPLQVLVVASLGNPVPGVTVVFVVPLTGASATFGGRTTVSAVTAPDGVATAPALKANGQAGSFTVTASLSTVSTLTAAFSLTNLAVAPAKATAQSGTPQSATVGQPFGSPLQVLVTDAVGHVVGGVWVTFTAPAAGPSGTFAGNATVLTNPLGIAQAPALSANTVAGKFTVTATVSGLSGAVSFALTNLPGSPAAVTPVGGTNQSTRAGTSFLSPLVALVTDAFGNPVNGVSVTFTIQPDAVTGAGGTFGGPTTWTAITSGRGLAVVPVVKANTGRGTFTVIMAAFGAVSDGVFSLTSM